MEQGSESESVGGYRWSLREPHEMQAVAISQRLGVPEIIGCLLTARGIHLEDADAFLNPTLKAFMPDPFHLKDMDKAVARLKEAIFKGEKIAVFGDYDVDGATSSALWIRFLRSLGVDATFYIPDRITEGYGPNLKAFLALREKGVRLIITVDCGTTAFEPLNAAAENGIDVIVMDHHSGEIQMPNVVALVNPNRFDESSSYKHLAAVGLVFLALVALNRVLRLAGFYQTLPEPNLLELLDIVALGTVCDVVPLTGINRAYVAQGLKVLAKRENIGLKTLCDLASVNETPTAYHLGFLLGPRINAGGRVGKSDLGVRLLVTDREEEALNIAQDLDALNQERQEIEARVLEEANQQALSQTEPVLLLAGPWHPGVIGIVAGRLKDRYYKPTFVMSVDDQGIAKGSARSIEGIHLGDLVHAAQQKGILLGGGGHAMAAGFSLHISQKDNFRIFLIDKLKGLDYDPRPIFFFDGYLSLKSMTYDFAESLDKIAPFGQANPTPKFVLNDVWIQYHEVLKGQHIKLILKDISGSSIPAFSFRSVDTNLGRVLQNHQGRWFNMLGTIKVNHWGGRSSVQFTIDDVRYAHERFGINEKEVSL